MCGLAGFLLTQAQGDLAATARAMNDAIRHRGPDDSGEWCDPQTGVALGHRRLAIVDLSPAGHQPMLSASGRYAMVFNGEIYNHQDQRAELAGLGLAPAWRGHSDTETMLAAFEAWGIEAALQRFVGMFAFALWDRQTQQLVLARDRLGEKPLYYGWQGGSLLFASELKALRAHPAFKAGIDRDAVAGLLRYNYVAAPRSIYQGIYKLPAAHYLLVPRQGLQAGMLPAPKPYWDALAVVSAGLDQTPVEPTAALDELERRLKRAVGEQMMADVPLGALLSGGVDSSTIVALMQAQSRQAVHTFCIGFHEKEFNEAQFAKQVAGHLGTHHTELYVTAQDALELIPRLPALFDEPLGDYSAIPTFLVAQLARRAVTVALSGDGGDELFGGYSRYFQAMRLWRAMGWAPAGLLRGLSAGLRGAARLAPLIRPILPRYEDRAQRVADVLRMPDFDGLYDNLLSQWRPPECGVAGAGSGPALQPLPPALRQRLSPWQAMALNDLHHYMPDHVLSKVDRAAMAVSLETRAPLLDHRVAEFALALPDTLKQRDGRSKWLLRQLLYRYVPPALIERPKMGFTVPVRAWLRGPLQEWAEDLLNESELRAEGLFETPAVREKWRQHRRGERDWAQPLWNVLVMRQWLRSLP